MITEASPGVLVRRRVTDGAEVERERELLELEGGGHARPAAVMAPRTIA